MNISIRLSRLASLWGMLVCCESVCLSHAIAEQPKGRNSFEQVQEQHRKRFREFSNEIQKLATECDDKGMADVAKTIRACDFVPDAQSLRVGKLPTEIRHNNQANGWEKRLRSLENDYTKDLYTQSKVALRRGYPGYAYNLVREAALHDPDNAQVRKVLGFVRSKNEWVTPFARDQMNQGKVWHEDFGWLPKSHVEKYINGERYFKNRWYSAEKEKVLRTNFNSAWEVRTDHYRIKTNVSLEKGVELGKALEDFYVVFNETFAGFFHNPEQLQKLFDGSNDAIRADARPYTVHFYRTREEYIERMQKLFPQVGVTNGVYLTSDRVAHFYNDPNNDHEGTLFHEATHQLFYESDKTNRSICDKQHFWIIEGIACYMESFERDNGAFSLGNLNHIRFVGARKNLLVVDYYVPLRKFTAFGMQAFQNEPEQSLKKNYTQAAGLARFFMHYDNGRYREALVNHLAQLYSGDQRIRDRAEDLDVLTGVEFEELDRQYAEDARKTDQQALLNVVQPVAIQPDLK